MQRLAAAIALLGLTVLPAAASQQGVVAIQNWKTMDLCARLAQEAFPDFTAEANARRDIKLKECLEGRNLPPRDPAAAPR